VLWKQMHLGVGANAFVCVRRCPRLSLSLSLSLTLSLSLAFVLTFAWWCIAVIFALTCLSPLLFVSFLFSLRLCLSPVTLFSTLLSVTRVLALDFCLSVSPVPFLSVAFFPTLSLSVSLYIFLSLFPSDSLSPFLFLSFFLSRSLSFFFPSLFLCVPRSRSPQDHTRCSCALGT